MQKVPLARPFYDASDLEAVKGVLESRWVAQGPTVQEFERRFSEYCGAKHGVAVNSATSALQLALMASGVKKGDEVIVPDFTFPATGNVVLFLGARVVLCDIDLDTYCLDVGDAERKVTRRTKALVPVHILGHPADMDAVNALAAERRLGVLEDAACAHGTEYRGRKAGSLGDLSAFSFHARKVLSTGEGGMVLTDDPKEAELLMAFRSHGMTQSAWSREKKFSLPKFEVLGYNMRMSDVTAALGLSQLARIDAFIRKRRELARLYRDALGDAGLPLALPAEAPGCRHNYQTFCIRLLRRGLRDRLLPLLQSDGIGCTIGTYSLSLLPLFKGKCPRGQNAFRNTVALPLYYEMGEEQVKLVAECLTARLRSLL